jgi:hypothetical protein
MAQRLTGMAAGAGVRLDFLYLLNAMEAVMSSVEAMTAIPAFAACSALAVRGGRSLDGEPVIAKNFDYLPLVRPLYAVRDSRPAGGLRSLDFTLAPMVGTVDGLNEAGLAITYNYAFTIDTADPAPTISMAIAQALAQCRTVEEAALFLGSYPRWGGAMLMLADAAGDLASLELSSTRSSLRRPAADEELIFHTNVFTSDELQAVEISRDAVYTKRAPRALVGERVLESPERRADRFGELLQDPAPLGPSELTAIMADHGPTGIPDDNTICMHGSYWHTTATVQLLPRTRRLRVAYDNPCTASYVDFEL